MRLDGIMRARIVVAAILLMVSLAYLYNWYSAVKAEFERHELAAGGDDSKITDAEKEYIANTFQLDRCGFSTGPECVPTTEEVRLVYAESAARYRVQLRQWPIELAKSFILPVGFWVVGSILGWVVRGFRQAKNPSRS